VVVMKNPKLNTRFSQKYSKFIRSIHQLHSHEEKTEQKNI